MKTVKLFVEGGGCSKSLHTACRSAFSSFLEKAGLIGIMPRIVACGCRNDAYQDYLTAVKNNEDAILLIDSENAVITPPDVSIDIKQWEPWYHLKNRRGQDGRLADDWDKPVEASNTDCHLMVMFMESWFLADRESLKKYYGQNFNEHCLPTCTNIETLTKDKVITSLKNATRNTQKGEYSKGEHSFKILELIDPNKVTNTSQWAKRFILLLKDKMEG